jgi:hypothetical protein
MLLASIHLGTTPLFVITPVTAVTPAAPPPPAPPPATETVSDPSVALGSSDDDPRRPLFKMLGVVACLGIPLGFLLIRAVRRRT